MAGVARMAILVGIDEAGFGPILGPLVVSSSAFSLPQCLLKADLWQVLKKSLCKTRKRLAGRLLVADSKKVYNKSIGIKHLERTVLAALRCLGKEPATLPELASFLCPDCIERWSDYPWYADISNHRLLIDGADKAIASAVLADDLNSNAMELLAMESCCLDVAYYNKMVANVRNKASVLFSATSRLIKTAYDSFCDDDLHIVVDRQGGRVHYRKNLQRMFYGMQLKILQESQTNSSYELSANGRAMRVHFVVGADERFLPVSLASMTSKYLRELLICNINRYFNEFGAELRPTAGYWKDGLRFVADIKANLPDVEFSSEQLIRSR
jgi:ribonuclease HII